MMILGYSYNSQGLLQSTVYPSNVTVGYAYDGYGNLASVTEITFKIIRSTPCTILHDK
ncbi:MAG: hypothetical protein E7095_03315 [Bacteroides sp.]|nr:hypothetical protein [Bacteroides sp.]